MADKSNEEITGSFKFVKKVVRKLVGWYVEPIIAEQRAVCEQINKLKEEQNVLLAQQKEKIDDTRKKHESALARLNEYQQRIGDIETREEWTRGQFTGHLQRIEDIEGREEWTREQFKEHLQRIGDIEGREEWTREQFKEHLQRIEDIEGREGWTRNQFEEHLQKIEHLENMIMHLADQDSNFYEKRTYSQAGEDTISAYIINFLRIPLNEVTYLDLGANHAKEMSNSYFFYQKGARGVLVEANPELIPELQAYRNEDTILNRAVALDERQSIDFYALSGDGLSTISYESAKHACEVNPDIYIKQKYTIPTITVNELLSQYFDKAPTILSIDLEGIESEILEQIDFEQSRPLIIILENIPYRPYLVIEMKQDKVLNLMNQNDYVEYAFTGINSIYVDKRYIEKFNDEVKAEKEEKEGN